MKTRYIVMPIVLIAMLAVLSAPAMADPCICDIETNTYPCNHGTSGVFNGTVHVDEGEGGLGSDYVHIDFADIPEGTVKWARVYWHIWMPGSWTDATFCNVNGCWNNHMSICDPSGSCTCEQDETDGFYGGGCGTTWVYWNVTDMVATGANKANDITIDNRGSGDGRVYWVVLVVLVESDNYSGTYYWVNQGYEDIYVGETTTTWFHGDAVKANSTLWHLALCSDVTTGGIWFNDHHVRNDVPGGVTKEEIPSDWIELDGNQNMMWDDGDDDWFHPVMAILAIPKEEAPDTQPPYTTGHDPAPNATNVPPDTNITVHVKDGGTGVNQSTLVMTVEGSVVTPTISGDKYDYLLIYDPPTDFGYGQVVDVTVDAADLNEPPNVMDTDAYQFTIAAGNIPPVADAGPDQNAGVNETVTFNGSGSYDPDGSIVSYEWDFGDGNTGTGEITTHAYSTEGTYTVTLTVTDNDGATGNDTAVVTVNLPGGYTGNHPLTIYEHGTISGGLVYDTVTDGSKYKCLWPVPNMSEETRPVLYQNLTVNIPENATVKTARLYNTYCWSCWGDDDYAACPPAQARLTLTDTSTHETWSTGNLTHSYTPANRDECPNPINSTNCPSYPGGVVHYWDTKGRTYASTMWDMPSGEFAWDVTGLVTHSGTYNASIVDPRDRLRVGDERFCTFGFGLLVVYEDPSSAKIKYEIAEGCDILMARTYETPENATTSATFGGVSNAVNANLTTVVTSSDGGTLDPPENMIYFNGIEIGPSTAGGVYHYGVNYFDVTSNLNTDQNVVEFQDRDDCEYVHNAFLVVELPDDVATADIPVKGTVTGTYMDTHVSDNVREAIEEVESKGKPTNRYSYLEHKWTIDVTDGSDAAFYVEAYHTANSEGDDFVFEYSKDDSTYTPMVTVTKIADDNACQTYTFTEPISGTVYIRVRDTDRTAGKKGLDTIHIDHMFIRSVSGPPGYGVTVTIDEVSQQVKPGENTTYTVSVKNTGDFEASYSVVMTGTAVDEGTITVSPLNWNTGTLAPNAEDVQTVTVSTTTTTPETTYTLTATATCEQKTSVTDSATSELVVSSAENTLHVDSIDMSLSDRTAGKNTFTHATAVVTIVDAIGIAVEGATVYGTWSNATSDTDSGVTNASGQVALDSDEVKNAKSGTTFTFTVDNVELTGWTYDSAANKETSDSISVP